MSRKIVAILAVLVLLVLIVVGAIVFTRSSKKDNVYWLGSHESSTPLKSYANAAVVSDAEQCASIGK